MTPPMSIATRMPLPASAVAAPRDVNRPVPTIMAAVSSTAVVRPRLLRPVMIVNYLPPFEPAGDPPLTPCEVEIGELLFERFDFRLVVDQDVRLKRMPEEVI